MALRSRCRHGRLEVEAEIQLSDPSGVTPTAGGIVFFGDMGGNFYVLDVANGQKLWGQKIGGAIAGGVITYTVNGPRKLQPQPDLPRFMADRNYDRKGLNLGPRRRRHEPMRRFTRGARSGFPVGPPVWVRH